MTSRELWKRGARSLFQEEENDNIRKECSRVRSHLVLALGNEVQIRPQRAPPVHEVVGRLLHAAGIEPVPVDRFRQHVDLRENTRESEEERTTL